MISAHAHKIIINNYNNNNNNNNILYINMLMFVHN